ncbi:hypothetical protein RFI_32823 [Reticulomyxa filosa]|uniref:Uncharacterized protein n=1 Tax=Reticulomyxa filosa TaxID=46433 RepID=X6LT66_RETFI|nr:hypothetical protein RFI_32823 [Reticulomyxa filosa]|eukprot:ETO04576.1 hypothetical protein RFI_32823 [Reticulomyxa filosa]
MISYQKDTIKKKKGSPIESPTVKRSKLERRQNLQLFLKSRSSKTDLTKKGILEKKNMTPQLQPVAETLQRRLSVRQDRSIIQKRGISKLAEELMIMITDSENFAQLDEQNEENIATKRYYEPAPSYIFSNEFINKAALDQITKSYSTIHNRRLINFDDDTHVDNNDVDQPETCICLQTNIFVILRVPLLDIAICIHFCKWRLCASFQA